MEASYTWHPGARGLNPHWPLTPPLLPDELFSSWLVRTALAHGCSPDALTSSAWPGSRAWCVDLDRGLEEARLNVLATTTGLSIQALSASMILPVAQSLCPTSLALRVGNWPWILVLGCRSRSRADGLLCCPECVSNLVPHYLVQHRLAWHTACPWHGVQLINRCHRCGSALQPGLLRADCTLAQCHRCGHLLSSGPRVPAASQALAFQVFADASHGGDVVYGQAVLRFSDWMYIARVMISFLQAVTRHPSAGTLRFCQAMGVDIAALRQSSLGLPFEYLEPTERAGLLGNVWAIMQAGPEQFMHHAAETALPVSALPVPTAGAPDILNRMAAVLTHNTQHKPGRHSQERCHTPIEVLRMWHRLQRKTHRNGIS